MVLKLTEQNFEEEVLKAEELVLVDFFAEWCGPCKMMSPIIDELVEEYSGVVKIGKLNVDEESAISGRYRVMNIPTLLLLKNGEVVDKVIGAIAKSQLIEKINKLTGK